MDGETQIHRIMLFEWIPCLTDLNTDSIILPQVKNDVRGSNFGGSKYSILKSYEKNLCIRLICRFSFNT